MGGKLPLDRFPRPGGRPWHATEWEIAQALQGHQQGNVRKVWIYRDVTDFPARTAQQSNAVWTEIDARHQAVAHYFETLNPDPETQRHSVNTYQGVPDLQRLLNRALRDWVLSQLPGQPGAVAGPTTPDSLSDDQLWLHQHLLADAPLPVDAAWRKRAALAGQAPASGWRSHLLRRYAAWCSGSGGQLDRRFVNLTLMVDRLPGWKGERFAVDARQRADGRYDDLAELLADQPDAGAWLLWGDPGCGKSTVLQHHELSTAQAALRAIAAGQRPAELCFWVRLSDYSSADADPADWLAQRWAAVAGPQLPAWPQACQHLRIRVLADGLNEIKAPDAAAQAGAMQRWAAWAAGLAQAGQGHLPPIFSVRTLEMGDGLQGQGLALRYIALGLWTDTQISQYCQACDTPAVAAALQAPQHAGLRDLCRLPFNLAAQCELYQHTGQLAQDRAELLSGVVWQRILHERAKLPAGALAAAGLLGPRDKQRLASGQWRQALRVLPEHGALVPALDAWAEQLHQQGRAVGFDEASVLDAFDRWQAQAAVQPRRGRSAAVAPADAAAWLHATQALDFIGVSGIDAYTAATQLRFTHQLWQEFFAGRGLRERCPPQPGPAALPDLAAPPLAELDEVLARLGTQDPLPGPGISHWEEPVKLALQLSTRPLDWLRHLQAVNLALAGRAAASCLARLQAEDEGRQLLAGLQTALLARSRDAGTDLRQRIEAAEALGEIGDPRYLALGGTGTGQPRCLLPQPAGWVAVPAGRYRIGTAGAEEDEQPVTPVPLAAFAMAFAPVTNAEFRCFIDAQGYEDERWWVGETALRWLHEGLRNEEQMTTDRQLFADARGDLAGTLARFPDFTQSHRDWLQGFAEMNEADTEAQLEAWYGARTYRQPQEWDNPRFNHPAQPVVGVSVFEAQAYCRWLSAQQPGQQYRLPTEAEWEAAARGSAGRRWPWAQPLGPERWQINADPAHLRRTTPVGVFPAGDTPEGLVDLSGNVWEWTTSRYTATLDREALTKPATDGGARRAVRGGSWSYPTAHCRPGYRNSLAPVGRGHDLGFRVVCCPIHEP